MNDVLLLELIFSLSFSPKPPARLLPPLSHSGWRVTCFELYFKTSSFLSYAFAQHTSLYYIKWSYGARLGYLCLSTLGVSWRIYCQCIDIKNSEHQKQTFAEYAVSVCMRVYVYLYMCVCACTFLINLHIKHDTIHKILHKFSNMYQRVQRHQNMQHK